MSGLADGNIVVRNARTHNLRHLDVDIPRNQLVVITGVSGSGKSSLAFDTLHAEGQRRYLDCLSPHTRQLLEHLPRPPVDVLEGLPPTLCIEQRGGTARSRSTVATLTEIHDHLRVLYARAGLPHCSACGTAISRQSPQAIVDQILSFEAGLKVMLLAPLVRGRKGAHADVFTRIAKDGFVRARVDGEILDIAEPPALAKSKPHDIEAVIDRIVVKPGLRDRLDESVALALRLGSGACIVSQQAGTGWSDHLYSSKFVCPKCAISYPEIEPRTFSFNSPYGACTECLGWGSIEVGDHFEVCRACEGTRLQPLGRRVTYHDVTITDLAAETVTDARQLVRSWLESIASVPAGRATPVDLIAQQFLTEVDHRLRYLDQVGVGYLTLDRPANTLSGGEFQRTRLAGCLGSGLLGVCYILDEPTIGLHPRDTRRLLDTLLELRDQGSSVLIVEHDLDVVRAADHVLDLGPGAGVAGGHLLAAGTPKAITAVSQSLTGAYLAGRLQVAKAGGDTHADSVSRTPAETLRFENVTLHNLRDVSVEIPLNVLTCITGVSGSGKSSLVMEALLPLLKERWQPGTGQVNSAGGRLSGGESLQRVVQVDQTPLGHSGRSNPATYAGLWDEIRKLFSRTREARAPGFRANRFSFNSTEGRCPACRGQGLHRLSVTMWSDVPLPCPVCLGKRFNPATLEIKYRDYSVADVLDLRIEDAAVFFASYQQLARPLGMFVEAGLGHLTLGQPATTLSGGESQRVKLATELGRDHHSPTLFILDEPTTGLHPHDISRVMLILRRLVNQGHSVLLIEHHLDVIAGADWVIDLGPEGGAGGGQVVAFGTPAQIAAQDARSHTGAALKEMQARQISL